MKLQGSRLSSPFFSSFICCLFFSVTCFALVSPHSLHNVWDLVRPGLIWSDLVRPGLTFHTIQLRSVHLSHQKLFHPWCWSSELRGLEWVNNLTNSLYSQSTDWLLNDWTHLTISGLNSSPSYSVISFLSPPLSIQPPHQNIKTLGCRSWTRFPPELVKRGLLSLSLDLPEQCPVINSTIDHLPRRLPCVCECVSVWSPLLCDSQSRWSSASHTPHTHFTQYCTVVWQP